METTTLQVWEDTKQLAEIKEIYGKDLSPTEWKTFCMVGMATGLNPILREIWAIKYSKSDPASIFIGRDGYRQVAIGDPAYDYHQVHAVYNNDDFTIENGNIRHSYQLKDRGQLVGAYCLVHRKGATQPITVFVPLKEYNTGKSVWSSKPETMIKKVAEAQALRMAFPYKFNGTYDESEQWEKPEPVRAPKNVVEIPSFKKGVEAVYNLAITKIDELMTLLGKETDRCEDLLIVKIDSKFSDKAPTDLTKKEMEEVLGDIVTAIETEKVRQKNTTIEEAIETEKVPEQEPEKDLSVEQVEKMFETESTPST